MSKKQFRSQASSGRAAFGAGATFGGSFAGSTFGSSSALSWVTEPPDLSGISDPNVAVSFKNLSKKDSTTKAKALEDLQTYVSSPGQEVEETVLEAWVKLYPRLSIDSSRRVRQLSHTLLGSIASKCGKRIAKHMPKVAGPWLAGAQDNDKAAARAAQDSLKSVFNSPEKLQNIGKAFQQPILEYCRDAILNETVQTLSDERAVSADDSEATYSRVIATSIAVISNLMRDLPPEETAKQQETYETIISESKVWDFASYKDVVVRRYVHRFLRASLAKQRPAVEANLQTISKAYIDKALHSDQTGSASDLIHTLIELTDAFPHAWTSCYSGKKAAGERLRQAVKKGSQAGTADYWSALWILITKLPQDVLPRDAAEVKKFLSSLHDGFGSREERFNASTAWETYYKVVDRFLATASVSEDQLTQLVHEMVLPIVAQYLRPSAEHSEWSIAGAKASVTVAKVAMVQAAHPMLTEKWPEYAAALIRDIKTSSPEQAKDFEKSQLAVAQSGERWALLQAEFVSCSEYHLPQAFHEVVISSTRDIIRESLQMLKARNGKPYGAAAVVDELLHRCREVVSKDEESRSLISAFVLEDLSLIILSPSQRQLCSLLYHYQDSIKDNFAEAWNHVASYLAQSPDSAEKMMAFRELLAYPRVKPAVELASANADVQEFLQQQYQRCIKDGDQWTFFAGAIRSEASVASPETIENILADLTASLSLSDRASNALQGLEQILASDRTLVKDFVGQPHGAQLLPSLLHLQESSDDAVMQKASSVSKRLIEDADKSSSQAMLFDVVHQSLNTVTADSLPINAVLEMATKLIDDANMTEQGSDIAKQALPSLSTWSAALSPYLNRQPPPSQAITSSIGGGVYLVKPSDSPVSGSMSRDSEGFSQALRFVLYTTRIFSRNKLLELVDQDSQSELFRHLILTFSLMSSGVELRGPHGLASIPDTDLEVPISKYQNEVAHLFTDSFSLYDDAAGGSHAFVGSAVDAIWTNAKQGGPLGYHNCEALGLSLSELQSQHGYSHPKVQEYLDKLLQMYKSREAVPFAACAFGLHDAIVDGKKLDRQTNELVADLTGQSIESPPEKVLELLVMLNSLLAERPLDGLVAKQRLIFLMKHIVPWLETEVVTPIKSEVFRLLCSVLPGISDIYGGHWADVLASISTAWSRGIADVETERLDHSGMVLVYSALQLYGVLRTLADVEEPNDDLLDAYKEHQASAYKSLINLLKACNGVPDADYLPLNALFDLLAQELAKMHKSSVEDAEELYPLLYAESQPLQKTAFNILHDHIPTLQEQISFDAALENKSPKLPEELCSLVLERPSLDSLEVMSLGQDVPRQLLGYLYSWQLVFDHFSNASYKVKSDYIESLKDGDYLPGLLDLIYSLLGHTRGKPVDVSKYNIVRYDYSEQSDDATSLTADRRLQWLLTHLFYQALSLVPSLTKAHYLSIKSRQTSLAVETWTAKYIAPLIIDESLASVVEWSTTTAKDDPDYENLTVKVSMRSREVNVGYLVDEQTMAIVVTLPEDYPLSGAKVDGVNRVAVDERKWQSWLRNCQGVITFSNGNLVDGLSTWRKNVTGTLKGQTECAICYSIVSGDKQLPSKRCSTCKNLFHSSCLFKWFKTSNASTCPLCRNPFNYG